MGNANTTPMTTFADLRRGHGPSQQAFASLCGLTQPQVSQYERALAWPTDDVIRRIASKSGETEPAVRAALQLSREIAKDPITKQQAELERLIGDLYLRTDEAGRLNLGAVMSAFGAGCFRLMQAAPSERLDWPRLASVARDHRLRIEALPRSPDWATSHGALVAAEGMAASWTSGQLLSDAWPGLVSQIERVLEHSDGDAQVERYVHDLGLTMLPGAQGSRERYLAAANHLADVWADYSFAFAERRMAPPLSHQQIAGVVSLSSGVADAVLVGFAVAEPALAGTALR